MTMTLTYKNDLDLYELLSVLKIGQTDKPKQNVYHQVMLVHVHVYTCINRKGYPIQPVSKLLNSFQCT